MIPVLFKNNYLPTATGSCLWRLFLKKKLNAVKNHSTLVAAPQK